MSTNRLVFSFVTVPLTVCAALLLVRVIQAQVMWHRQRVVYEYKTTVMTGGAAADGVDAYRDGATSPEGWEVWQLEQTINPTTFEITGYKISLRRPLGFLMR